MIYTLNWLSIDYSLIDLFFVNRNELMAQRVINAEVEYRILPNPANGEHIPPIINVRNPSTADAFPELPFIK